MERHDNRPPISWAAILLFQSLRPDEAGEPAPPCAPEIVRGDGDHLQGGDPALAGPAQREREWVDRRLILTKQLQEVWANFLHALQSGSHIGRCQ